MVKPEVLVVDDEVEVGTFFEYYLAEERGYSVSVANSGSEASALIRSKPFDLALVDLKLPDTDGIAILKEIKSLRPNCEVIIMTGYSTVKTAVEAMKLGAFDYIDKPFEDLEELDKLLDRAVNSLQNKAYYFDEEVGKLAEQFGIVLGKDSPLRELLVLCKKVATRKISVLIEGETGTGKEVLARFIHACSPRAAHPFIAVNCGALSETLLESELFGHEKGAFTGAHTARHGVFELADRGTLFLDEIGEASPAIQVKLLRVLETGEFFRVGGEKPVKADVRIIAATNRNLREAAKEKLFREDLLYRLDVVYLSIPPLRDRKMDIIPLFNYFVSKCLPEEERKTVIEFSPGVLEMLYNYPWPGNVRELSNIVARIMTLREGNRVGPECLPEYIRSYTKSVPGWDSARPEEDFERLLKNFSERMVRSVLSREKVDINEVYGALKEAVNGIVRAVIEKAIEITGGNKTEAAKFLGTTPRIMRYLLKEKIKH